MPVKPLTSILVKPAGPDCNLRCAYCFYLEKAGMFPETRQHRMNLELLEQTVKQVMQDGGEMVNFGWQGGEPTLMGLEFFRKAVEFQRRYGAPGQTVGNGLQTNGLLLNEAWAEFLAEYQFLIGLSLDGTKAVHDGYRRTIGDEPTWERVMKSARMMLSKKVAVNALSVVNNVSVNHADETYDFHKSLGLRYMQFIPCVETNPERPGEMAPFSVTPEAYGEFICRIFDRWLGDFKNALPTTSVRWFDSLFYTYVGMSPPDCTLLPECGCYVVVEHNGDVYSCDFFVEDQWRLGNVMRGDLLEMLNSPRQGEFGRMKSHYPPECHACQWLPYCHGGCTKDRMRNPQTGGSNHFCRSYKIFFEHAHPRMQQLAARWLEQQRQRELEEERRAMRQGHGGTRTAAKNAPCPCGSGKKHKHCCGKGR